MFCTIPLPIRQSVSAPSPPSLESPVQIFPFSSPPILIIHAHRRYPQDRHSYRTAGPLFRSSRLSLSPSIMNDPFSPFPIPFSPRCERRRTLIETSDIVSGPAKSRWNLGGGKTRVGIPRGKAILNAKRATLWRKSYFGTLASALCPNKERWSS